MKEEGINPDLITYNAVLDACGKNQDKVRILRILEEMDKKGIEPDVVTYTTLIAAFARLVSFSLKLINLTGRIRTVIKVFP